MLFSKRIWQRNTSNWSFIRIRELGLSEVINRCTHSKGTLIYWTEQRGYIHPRPAGFLITVVNQANLNATWISCADESQRHHSLLKQLKALMSNCDTWSPHLISDGAFTSVLLCLPRRHLFHCCSRRPQLLPYDCCLFFIILPMMHCLLVHFLSDL